MIDKGDGKVAFQTHDGQHYLKADYNNGGRLTEHPTWIQSWETFSLVPIGNMDDVIFGASGDDVIFGGHGNDGLNGGSGNDDLRGETGRET